LLAQSAGQHSPTYRYILLRLLDRRGGFSGLCGGIADGRSVLARDIPGQGRIGRRIWGRRAPDCGGVLARKGTAAISGGASKKTGNCDFAFPLKSAVPRKSIALKSQRFTAWKRKQESGADS